MLKKQEHLQQILMTSLTTTWWLILNMKRHILSNKLSGINDY